MALTRSNESRFFFKKNRFLFPHREAAPKVTQSSSRQFNIVYDLKSRSRLGLGFLSIDIK
jgi:hypothetical protein